MHRFKLTSSLNRAREHKLLRYWRVHSTPSTVPGPDDIKVLVTAAGGHVVADTPTSYVEDLIVISCKDDMAQVWIYQIGEKALYIGVSQSSIVI